MACPFLTGSRQKSCAASKKLVVLCLAELEGKCRIDAKYHNCELYQTYRKEIIVK